MGARRRGHAIVRPVRMPGHAMGETPDLSLVTEGLGEGWEIMATSYKPYPCGFVIHPVLDCVLDWRRDNPKAEVTRVVVRGNPLLSDRTDRPNISTGRESQVSVQHAVAAALATGKAGLDQFTDACARDPDVLALRGKVEVLRDPALSTIAAAAEITTAGGKTHKLSQPAARGSDVNPLSDADLVAKLQTAASVWNPRHDVAPLIDAIWHRSPCPRGKHELRYFSRRYRRPRASSTSAAAKSSVSTLPLSSFGTGARCSVTSFDTSKRNL